MKVRWVLLTAGLLLALLASVSGLLVAAAVVGLAAGGLGWAGWAFARRPRRAASAPSAPRPRIVLALAAAWGIVAAAWLLPFVAMLLGLALDNALPRPFERMLRAIAITPYSLLDEMGDLFLVSLFEGAFTLFMGLGFVALFVAPPVMGLACAFLARRLLDGREWARVTTLVVLGLLALGSAVAALGPDTPFESPSPAMRAANGIIAVSAAVAAWRLARRR